MSEASLMSVPGTIWILSAFAVIEARLLLFQWPPAVPLVG